MNRRVIIKTYARVRETGGSFTETPSTLATVWASIEPSSSNERYQFGQLAGEMSHTIRIRYLAGVTLSSTITYGSRVFQVLGMIDESEQHKWLRLACVEELIA